MTVPTFVVAGAARSGTTGLVEGLRAHPQVFVTTPKEPHYFAMHGRPADFRGPGDAATINRVAVTDRERYLHMYPSRHQYLALGEGSVSTLYYAERAAPELLRVNPEMRAVVILRDPVDRAHSSYLYMRARGFEPHEDFRRALADEDRRRAENWHHIWHYTQMSYYAEGLRTLREHLGADRVGVWFHDNLDEDYESVISSVLRFLDVAPHPAETGTRVNVSGTVRFPTLQRTIWWATRHEYLRRSIKQLTSYGFRERIRRNILLPTTVPHDVRLELEPLFQDDLRTLATMVTCAQPAWLARHARV